MKTGTSERPDLPLAAVIGAGGMGMAVARRLGQHYRLLLADLSADRLDKCVAALREEGHDAKSQVCDITDPAAVAAVAQTVSATGPLRVLAHVAGLSPSMADWRTLMRVNLVGAFLMADAMLPLATQGTAAIFISSLAAHMIAPSQDVVKLIDDPLQDGFLDSLAQAADMNPGLAYQFSKYSMNRMCQRRAWDWGQSGARIVSLSPGLIATPMGALEFERQPMKYDLLAKTPLQREGTMLEIGAAVAFLASDAASFISGADLLVDGGIAASLRFGAK